MENGEGLNRDEASAEAGTSDFQGAISELARCPHSLSYKDKQGNRFKQGCDFARQVLRTRGCGGGAERGP